MSPELVVGLPVYDGVVDDDEHSLLVLSSLMTCMTRVQVPREQKENAGKRLCSCQSLLLEQDVSIRIESRIRD